MIALPSNTPTSVSTFCSLFSWRKFFCLSWHEIVFIQFNPEEMNPNCVADVIHVTRFLDGVVRFVNKLFLV